MLPNLRRYLHYDVFTEHAARRQSTGRVHGAGGPRHRGDGVDDARDELLGVHVRVSRRDCRHRHRLRIFGRAGNEMPFAGHPSSARTSRWPTTAASPAVPLPIHLGPWPRPDARNARVGRGTSPLRLDDAAAAGLRTHVAGQPGPGHGDRTGRRPARRQFAGPGSVVRIGVLLRAVDHARRCGRGADECARTRRGIQGGRRPTPRHVRVHDRERSGRRHRLQPDGRGHRIRGSGNRFGQRPARLLSRPARAGARPRRPARLSARRASRWDGRAASTSAWRCRARTSPGCRSAVPAYSSGTAGCARRSVMISVLPTACGISSRSPTTRPWPAA